jgi:hypothetical protein
MPDVAYYTLPAILSFKGIDDAINKDLGDQAETVAKKAGEDYAQSMADGVKPGRVRRDGVLSTAGSEIDRGLSDALKVVLGLWIGV